MLDFLYATINPFFEGAESRRNVFWTGSDVCVLNKKDFFKVNTVTQSRGNFYVGKLIVSFCITQRGCVWGFFLVCLFLLSCESLCTGFHRGQKLWQPMDNLSERKNIWGHTHRVLGGALLHFFLPSLLLLLCGGFKFWIGRRRSLFWFLA